ncbi:MAG: hypothetical protein J3K34DRAFT_50615 [Monoraphidium minutum]|nr:MAG: hypothetical protein J3K34DRAFT_50615 [Monoraphidium minutum]
MNRRQRRAALFGTPRAAGRAPSNETLPTLPRTRAPNKPPATWAAAEPALCDPLARVRSPLPGVFSARHPRARGAPPIQRPRRPRSPRESRTQTAGGCRKERGPLGPLLATRHFWARLGRTSLEPRESRLERPPFATVKPPARPTPPAATRRPARQWRARGRPPAHGNARGPFQCPFGALGPCCPPCLRRCRAALLARRRRPCPMCTAESLSRRERPPARAHARPPAQPPGRASRWVPRPLPRLSTALPEHRRCPAAAARPSGAAARARSGACCGAARGCARPSELEPMRGLRRRIYTHICMLCFAAWAI